MYSLIDSLGAQLPKVKILRWHVVSFVRETVTGERSSAWMHFEFTLENSRIYRLDVYHALLLFRQHVPHLLAPRLGS